MCPHFVKLTAFLYLFTKFVSMSKERIVGEYLLLYGDKGIDLQHPSKMVVKYTHTRIPKMKQKNKHFPDIVRQTPTGGRIGQIYIEAHLCNSMSFQRKGV